MARVAKIKPGMDAVEVRKLMKKYPSVKTGRESYGADGAATAYDGTEEWYGEALDREGEWWVTVTFVGGKVTTVSKGSGVRADSPDAVPSNSSTSPPGPPGPPQS